MDSALTNPSGPVFVVVGHVNRGKSSIVSTLAADDSVRVAPEPGTTVHNRPFPMRIEGRTLYTLIDTPGFERARQTLDLLRGYGGSTSARADAVRRFIADHAADPRFAPECELLRPVMAGGAILYVVDGSVPFSPHYEAEMEVLRWTTQPRMALINTIGPEDHTAAWRSVLDQYFSLVRGFDAHDASFHERTRLLWAARELREDWRDPMDCAIEALNADRRETLRAAAAATARALCQMLTHIEEEKLLDDADPEPRKAALAERYYRGLRRFEQRARDDLRSLYGHHHFDVHDAQLRAVNDDLFNTDTWSRLGLTRGQLGAAAAFTGALAGGVIDVAVGGASVMLGSLIGATVGYGSTWLGWKHLEEVTLLGQRLAGRLLRIGPMRNPQFPWVALDRALIYHDHVSRRPHAHRQGVTLGEYHESEGVVRSLDPTLRGELEKCFAKIRKPMADANAAEGKLAGLLNQVLLERDKVGA